MSKADKNKILYIISISLLLFLNSCIDTGVENIPQSIDYMSQVKFVNAVPGSGPVTITVNSEQIGTAEPGAETPAGSAFKVVPAGAKTINAGFPNSAYTFNLSTDTEYKMRIFITSNGTDVTATKSLQRYIWQEKGTASGQPLYPPDTAQVAIFNASPDVAIDEIGIHSSSEDRTISLEAAVAYRSGIPYIKLAAPAATDYQLYVIQEGDTLSTISLNVSPQSRYTAVIYDNSSDLKNSVFIDD
jgi:hypothetical protein